MAQQPVVVQRGPIHVGWRLVFIIIAVVLAAVAGFIALGDVSTKWEGALIPFAIAFFAAAHA